MHEIYELKDKLMEELKEYGRKGEMSTGSLEVVDKLTHTIKNLCKIIEDSEMEERGYSGMYYPYSREGGTQGGRSYARGRGRNARRDSMGRYSSRGYSYAEDDMVEQLTDLMEEAPEHIKKDIQKLITKVEQM